MQSTSTFSKKCISDTCFPFSFKHVATCILACVQQMHSSRFSPLGLIPQCFDCHKKNISSIWQHCILIWFHLHLLVNRMQKLTVAMRLKCAKFKLNQGFWIWIKILLSDSNFMEDYSLLILIDCLRVHLHIWFLHAFYALHCNFFITHLNWWKLR